jgi:HAD superfamily hydrolase (TIGR01484 family)
MKYRMIALDLDGTLLDSSGTVTPLNREAVARAREAGVLVVLCTGRGLAESAAAIEALSHRGPVVLAGGALVADPTNGKTLHRAVIAPYLARELVNHFVEAGHAALILPDPDPQDFDYIVVNPGALTPNTRWWFKMIGAEIHYVEEASDPDLHHALRVGIVGPPGAMPAMQQSLERRFGTQIMVQHFVAVKQDRGEDVHVLETFAAGVSKWSGLTWLASEHGIALDEVAAIGDHVNDIIMINNAACGVAMANAVDGVMAVADRVTGTNDASGVADAIDRMLSGEW